MTLIERLQEAPEGSREFDAEIAVQAGWKHQKVQSGVGLSGMPIWSHEWETPDGRESDFERVTELLQGNPDIVAADLVPHYTTSIDVALTLLLPGWWAEIFAREDQPSVRLHEFQLPCRKIPDDLHVVPGATCALALCAAIMKSREALTALQQRGMNQ